MLEAVVICLDDSDWSRNRDCTPSRLQAQQEAAVAIANSKLQENAENSIGLVTLAGSHVHVRASPSGDMGTFLGAVQSVEGPDGEVDLIKGIQTAQLALKHRLNRNQRQRIIVFVCSPLKDTNQTEIERVGKALKKNNVSIDVISFAEVSQNSAILKKLYQAANAENTSHLLEVDSDVPSLARAVKNSEVLNSSAAMVSDDPFDMDPNADPELLMALRLSLDEERQRQMAQQQQAAVMRTGDGPESFVPAGERGPTSFTQGDSCSERIQEDRPPTTEEIMGLDIDEDLRQALLLSLQSMEDESRTSAAAEAPPADAPPPSATTNEAANANSSEVFNTPAEGASFASISPRPSDMAPAPAASDSATKESVPPLTADELKLLGEMLPGVDVNDEEIIKAFREFVKMQQQQQQQQGGTDPSGSA